MSLALARLEAARKEIALLAVERPSLLSVALGAYEAEREWKAEEATATAAAQAQSNKRALQRPALKKKSSAKQKGVSFADTSTTAQETVRQDATASTADTIEARQERTQRGFSYTRLPKTAQTSVAGQQKEEQGALDAVRTRSGRKKRKVRRLGQEQSSRRAASSQTSVQKSNAGAAADIDDPYNAGYPKLCDFGCGFELRSWRSKPGHEKACPGAVAARQAKIAKKTQAESADAGKDGAEQAIDAQVPSEAQAREEESVQKTKRPEQQDDQQIEQQADEENDLLPEPAANEAQKPSKEHVGAKKPRSAKKRAYDVIASANKEAEGEEEEEAVPMAKKAINNVDSQSASSDADDVFGRLGLKDASLAAKALAKSAYNDDEVTRSDSSEAEPLPRPLIDQETGEKYLDKGRVAW